MVIAQQVMALGAKLDSLRSVPRTDVMEARVNPCELFSGLTRMTWCTAANTYIRKRNLKNVLIYIFSYVCAKLPWILRKELLVLV